MWSTKNNSCYGFPRPPNLPLSIKMVLHQRTFGLTAFVLYLVWHNIQHLRKNLLEQCLCRMWWYYLSLDHGLDQHVCNNSSIILIVVKWSTYTVVIKKSKDNGLKSVYYAFKRLKKYTTHYVIKACTLYERLNRSPYITTQAFFARKNPNLAKSLASFNTFCHAIITFVDTKITWFNSPRRVFSVGGK